MRQKKDTYFQFKQFQVAHDRCSMKVGTDAVLLGAWTNVDHASRILEIGSGSGVISLMIAQRTPADTLIHGVEIEPDDCVQAEENIMKSPWPNKIKIYCTSIQDYYSDGPYDLIVSNPPFFKNSMLPSSARRKTSRHTQSLNHNDLLNSVKRLMSPAGKFVAILPYTEGISFIKEVTNYQLHCKRQCAFRARIGKPVERWLLEFGVKSIKKIETEIIHYSDSNNWSEEYIQLTKEFYL